MPPDESRILNPLEAEVQSELDLARSSNPEEEITESPAEWLYDPVDVEREQIGLTNLLGAAEALDRDSRPDA